MVKIYPPDVNQDENARANFDKITEAYTTLIDLTQRYFYDRHGHTSEELKKRGTPSIFDWTPKYGIYNEQTTADGESREQIIYGHFIIQHFLDSRSFFENI